MEIDYFERSHKHWSAIDGRRCHQIETEETGTEQMLAWLAEAAGQLTERQRAYIDAYYNYGLSQQRIAEMYGKDVTTISRIISAGMKKIQVWLEDKVLVRACILENGEVNWDRILREAKSMPDQQCRLLAMMRTGRFPTYTSLADHLGLNRSTVSRTISRGVCTLVQLGVPAECFEWLRQQEQELRRKGAFRRAGTQGNYGCADRGLAG